MKKILIIATIISTVTCFAGPKHVPQHNGHHKHQPVTMFHGYHGNCVVRGILGAIIGCERHRPHPKPEPIVVTYKRQVWIDGKYIEFIKNGEVIRIWQPGHWEIIK